MERIFPFPPPKVIPGLNICPDSSPSMSSVQIVLPPSTTSPFIVTVGTNSGTLVSAAREGEGTTAATGERPMASESATSSGLCSRILRKASYFALSAFADSRA